MAELADMLNDLLSDPKTGEKLRALLDSNSSDPQKGGSAPERESAPTDSESEGGGSDMLAGLLGSLSGKEKSQSSKSESSDGKALSGGDAAGLLSALAGGGGGLLPEGIDPAMMMKLTRAMAAMNSKQTDSRTRLLYDLKPYISGGRARRVDEAAQMLKMISVLDIFRDGF